MNEKDKISAKITYDKNEDTLKKQDNEAQAEQIINSNAFSPFQFDVFNNIPQNGGNQFETAVKLEALLGKNGFNFYWFYLSILRYYRNMWFVKGDKKLERAWPLFIDTLMRNGVAGIYKDKDGNPTPRNIVSLKNDYAGKVESGEGFFTMPLAVGNDFDHKLMKKIKMNSKNSVFATRGIEGFGVIVEWYDALLTMDRLYRVARNMAWASGKKLIFSIRGNDLKAKELEMKSYLNPDSPVILKMNNNDEERGNDWNMVEGTNDNSGILDAVREIQSFWNDIWGKRQNNITPQKKERLITDEMAFESENFNIMEYDIEVQLHQMIDDYNELFGKKVQLFKRGQRTPEMNYQLADNETIDTSPFEKETKGIGEYNG